MTLEKTVKSFANGMKQASEIIIEMKPDFVISPMMGSVPFIDSMYVVNPNFDPNTVFYMPASSHVPNINRIMDDWMNNFLDTNVTPDHKVSIITLDEVVSGGSATRVNNAIKNAIGKKTKKLASDVSSLFWATDIEKFQITAAYLDSLTDHEHHQVLSQIVSNQAAGIYNNDRNALSRDSKLVMNIVKSYFQDHIKLKGIGIEDSKNETYTNRPRNPSYTTIVEEGRIIPVLVDTILTMDNPDLCPVTYQRLDQATNQTYIRFKPIVDQTPKITSKYLELLKKLGEVTNGRKDAAPISVERAKFSGDYLSSSYGGNYNSVR